MAKKKKKKAQVSPAADPKLQSIAHQSRTTLFTRKIVSKKVYKRKPKHKNSRDWASFLPQHSVICTTLGL